MSTCARNIALVFCSFFTTFGTAADNLGHPVTGIVRPAYDQDTSADDIFCHWVGLSVKICARNIGTVTLKMSRSWILRPSTFCLVLTFGGLFYYLIHDRPKNFHYSGTIIPILVAVFLYVRKMEDDSVKGFDDDDPNNSQTDDSFPQK
jgi:hypothetical protein